MASLFRRLRARLRNTGFDDDLREELRIHEEMKREELEAGGLAPDEARSAARRALGNTALMRENSRRVWIAPWLESVAQDARYAVSSLARQPLHTFTALAILVLAIGLGTTLFTLFKGAVLAQWPARDPDRIVRITARADGRPVGPSVAEYQLYAEQAGTLSDVAVYVTGAGNRLETRGRATAYAPSAYISSTFFPMMQAGLQLGSGLIHEDDLPGRRPVALISHYLWRSHFNEDPSVVGLPVTIDGKPFTIVGVVEPRIDGLGRQIDLWLPLSAIATVGPVMSAGIEAAKAPNCCINTVARLADGVSREHARLELQMLHERFTSATKQKTGTVALYGTSNLGGPTGADFGVIGAVVAAVGLVVLLACANVGNLQLARGMARRREIATRVAIGASRGRVVRQLVVEGLVLAGAAGAVSIAAAAVLWPVVMAALGPDVPPAIARRYAVDWQVVAFTATVCGLACLGFALAPALHATRGTIPLSAMDRGGTRRARFALRSGLLATQIAACTVLLLGAGLVTRAIMHVMAFDPGFDMAGITRVSVLQPHGTSSEAQREFKGSLIALLEQEGVEPVAASEMSPVTDFPFSIRIALPGEQPSQYREVLRRSVSSRYFDALRIPLVSGRMFTSTVVGEIVVNEAFARMYFGGENPVGRTVREIDNKGAVTRAHTVVGMVRDAYVAGLERIDPIVFRPTTSGTLLTAGGAATVERIRALATGLDAAVRVRAWPLTDDLSEELQETRVGAAVAWAIGLLGLLLASVGVLGVFAYAVEERRREIGVRLALGASGAQIVRALVGTSGRAMLAGLGLGLLLSLACGPVLGSYLYGLSPLDPIAYGGVMLLLAATGAIATVVPARRACRVDPAVTLREE